MLIILIYRLNPLSLSSFSLNFVVNILYKKSNVQGVRKNSSIATPKSEFLSLTFEVYVVARLFHSGSSAVFGFESFDFIGPKSEVEILQNNQKYSIFFNVIFLVVKMQKKIENI